MYRCTRPIPPDDLAPDQFKRVKEFFAEFEAIKGQHPGLYQTFDTADAFEKLLLDHLQKLLLGFGERLSGKPVPAEVVQVHGPRVPDNLPRRAPFFGRTKDMAIALRALSVEDRTWGVLVDGIGGIGKSALAALELPRERADDAAGVQQALDVAAHVLGVDAAFGEGSPFTPVRPLI